MADIEVFKTLFPEFQASFWNRVTYFSGHTGTVFSLSYILPRKKCKYRSRSAGFISKIEVVGLRVIKIDGFLDQAQSEGFGIKIVVALRISGNSRDMMEPQYFIFHYL